MKASARYDRRGTSESDVIREPDMWDLIAVALWWSGGEIEIALAEHKNIRYLREPWKIRCMVDHIFPFHFARLYFLCHPVIQSLMS